MRCFRRLCLLSDVSISSFSGDQPAPFPSFSDLSASIGFLCMLTSRMVLQAFGDFRASVFDRADERLHSAALLKARSVRFNY